MSAIAFTANQANTTLSDLLPVTKQDYKEQIREFVRSSEHNLSLHLFRQEGGKLICLDCAVDEFATPLLSLTKVLLPGRYYFFVSVYDPQIKVSALESVDAHTTKGGGARIFRVEGCMAFSLAKGENFDINPSNSIHEESTLISVKESLTPLREFKDQSLKDCATLVENLKPGESIVIGRDPAKYKGPVTALATIHPEELNIRAMSRIHLKAHRSEDGATLFVEDLRSKTGTYINGCLISPFVSREVNLGDKVTIPLSQLELMNFHGFKNLETVQPEG